MAYNRVYARYLFAASARQLAALKIRFPGRSRTTDYTHDQHSKFRKDRETTGKLSKYARRLNLNISV